MASIWLWLSGWHRGALGHVRVTSADTQPRSLVSWAEGARTRREDEAQRRHCPNSKLPHLHLMDGGNRPRHRIIQSEDATHL